MATALVFRGAQPALSTSLATPGPVYVTRKAGISFVMKVITGQTAVIHFLSKMGIQTTVNGPFSNSALSTTSGRLVVSSENHQVVSDYLPSRMLFFFS